MDLLPKKQVRQNNILSMLSKEKTIATVELSKRLQVSENTIRKDLHLLELKGLIKRFHGSVTIVEQDILSLNYQQRYSLNVEAKQRMAQQAYDLIPEHASVLIDAGSSCFNLLCLLEARKDITIITPSLAVLELSKLMEQVSVILVGGIFAPRSNSALGTPAEDFIAKMNIDILFLGVTALEKEGSLYVNNYNEVGLKKAMIAASRQSIVLADASKWNKRGLVPFAPSKDIDIFISA